MATVTAGAALIAVVRYAREQQWKRQQAIFDFLDGWLDTPGAHNAARMLGSPSREIPLWDNGAPEKRWTTVTWEDVAAAFSRDDRGELPNTPRYTAIRDCFGDFFHRLSRLERMLEAGLVKEQEAAFVMQHWINVFRDQCNAPHIRNIRAETLSHQSSRMPSLFKRFGLDVTAGGSPIFVSPRRESDEDRKGDNDASNIVSPPTENTQ